MRIENADRLISVGRLEHFAGSVDYEIDRHHPDQEIVLDDEKDVAVRCEGRI